MTRSRTMLAVALAVVATACAQRMTRESGGDVDISSRAMGDDWGGDLRGIGGWSAIRGSAYARPSETGTTVSLTVERGVAGGAYGWEVLEGKCGSEGRSLAAITVFPPAFLDKSGRGAAVASLPMKLERGKQYFINVYGSDQRTTVVACGALKD